MVLKDQVAIVTGGAQGIGRGSVERFIEAGASGVVIADIQAEVGENAAQEIMSQYGGQVLAVEVDVSVEAQVESLVATTMDRFGRIDILVNNAGLYPVVAWEDVTLESWNHLLAVNLTGAFLCTKSVIPYMKSQDYGRIVYISSEAAFTGSALAHVAYGVSKSGMLALMKSIAKLFASHNIRANAITPGPIDTPGAHDLGDEFWTAADDKTLLKRHASIYEVADVILFLVSDPSSYITGQVLRVNGGWDLG